MLHCINSDIIECHRDWRQGGWVSVRAIHGAGSRWNYSYYLPLEHTILAH
jgi:hypothetical protein